MKVFYVLSSTSTGLERRFKARPLESIKEYPEKLMTLFIFSKGVHSQGYYSSPLWSITKTATFLIILSLLVRTIVRDVCVSHIAERIRFIMTHFAIILLDTHHDESSVNHPSYYSWCNTRHIVGSHHYQRNNNSTNWLQYTYDKTLRLSPIGYDCCWQSG